ncbi:Alkali-sensitive linkage protein 1 [Leucoagaricus sp. SymC.cos]|nr:Alkali-sensitive linkage protein 1 [Leucoagaricus sp. SymC.cos]
MLFSVASCTILSCLLASASANRSNLTSTSTSHTSTSSFSSLSSSSSSSSTTQAPSSTQDASTSSFPTPSPAPELKPGQKNPKRGIAFASNGNTDDILNANQTKGLISWVYDWADLPPAYIAQSHLKYIPMQWGSGNIDKLASAVSAQEADTILGFNEPDFVNEANIGAKDAAALWMQFIQPLKQQGIRIGGPAVTAAPTGKQWLSDFLSECSQCSIDFLPLHWYGSGTEGFYSYIWDMHSSFPQLPIWVTEYADVSENSTEVWDFMNQTTHYLDALDWIERYAWFGFFRPEDNVHYNMLGEDGSLNDLGQLYI